MLDFAFFSRSKTAADVQVFTTWDAVGNAWYPWVKPRGRTIAHLICVGGGGGGGSGVNGSAGTNRAGGGGGGSGAVSRLTIPMMFLPDRLFVLCGQGQNGTGGTTYIAVYPSNAQINLILSAVGGAAGANGSGSTGGAGGTAANASAATISPALGWGIFNSVAGQAGVAGGSNNGFGTSITLGGASPLSGGAGGGGVNSAGIAQPGGNINSNLPFPQITGGTTDGASGGAGIVFQFPFLLCGGTGGASSNANPPGNGGVPTRGCGAGGAGGGNGSVTAPIGGSGIAWIISC